MSTPSASTQAVPASGPPAQRQPRAATVGGGVYRIASDGSGVEAYSGSGADWIPIGGPTGKLYGGGYGLFSTSPGSGDLYRYTGVSTNWELVGGPGAQFVVTANRLYSLSPDRQGVYAWTGSGTNWSRIGGPALSIAPGS